MYLATLLQLKRLATGTALMLAAAAAIAHGLPGAVDQIADGVRLRQQGLLDSAIARLETALGAADLPELKSRAAGELGITLLQAHRPEQAAEYLQRAYAATTGSAKARYAIFLGNLAFARKEPGRARTLYNEAIALAPQDRDVALSAGLNLVRLSPLEQRLAQLQLLSKELNGAPDSADRASEHLNLGDQARRAGPAGVGLAYTHLARARVLAQSSGNRRLEIQAIDVLAQLYEDRGRNADALALSGQALGLAATTDPAQSADLLINLEWRNARLNQAAGRVPQALAAYQRALALIESVRQDIPIFYEDGRSSFASTLEPIYTGYSDLVLRQLDRQPAAMKETQLRSVLQTLESMRQSEIQDFLGDRCTVEAVQGGASGALPAGSSVLYPIALSDRIELLLVTANGIQRRTTPVPASEVRAAADSLSRLLREDAAGYLVPARKLYDWLLRPFDAELKDKAFTTLVVAPNGPLRLVPMSVLNDGKQFVIERFAVSMVTGMSMTNMSPKPGSRVDALVAGVSFPGPVVEKLNQAMMGSVAENAPTPAADTRSLAPRRLTRSVRSLSDVRQQSGTTRGAGSSLDELRERFALPGVKEEVDALRVILTGTNILNQDFTVGHFSEEAESGRYRIVHIATHGFFGGSADASFIMAYDDLLTINGLQSLLKSESFEKNPIELLSLSACQTAEGNDRAPLGISGAAIKARAKSVVGTLWPVDDAAAKSLMKSLYTGIAVDGLSKTEALRRAQLELLHSNTSQTPFFWAAFVLIGNWL